MVLARDDERPPGRQENAGNFNLDGQQQQLNLHLQPPANQIQPQQQVLGAPIDIADAAIPHHVQRIAIRLPTFWFDKPAVWFSQAEAQFALANIRTEITKYYHVISNLDIRAASEVEDIINAPPVELPYTNLRRTLIERLSASEEQRVRQLLHDEELGDRKPSQFLRHLKSLAGPTIVQPNLLRQLWLRRLPTQVQTVLTARPELSLEQISDLADKIVEVSTFPAVHAATHTPGEVCTSTNTNILSALEKLNLEVSELRSHRDQKPQQSRNRSRQRSRSRSDKLCWYHSRFGDKARKCIPPCEGNDKDSQ